MLVSFRRILAHPGRRWLCSQAASEVPLLVLEFLKNGVACTSRQFTSDDISKFAQLTGDCNAIHTDRRTANEVGFDRCVVHGALLNGLVSGLIAQSLPNCVVLSQELHFPQALLVDETVTVSLELIERRKTFVSVKYTCRDTSRRVVMHGDARLALAIKKPRNPASSPSSGDA
ncbi:hydroxyacyl-thioester dehydratase type 2 [Tropilaelaps mercedesae]|uniref:Hydroxyacyl-thioester dehydratase type 2 n=1 Tax=Tropilaelaps mercedesae TaxID=418985 RepID=A0A1V9XM41_9ACAR|nr:hydroxyacyl-thioester dehydratase type 2 [Tropilaelaps mercedesae]